MVHDARGERNPSLATRVRGSRRSDCVPDRGLLRQTFSPGRAPPHRPRAVGDCATTRAGLLRDRASQQRPALRRGFPAGVEGDPDPFFAIDGALSWLERDAARREGLRVSEGGRKLAFSPEHETGDRRTALYLERVNQQGKIIDFGPVRTDGSVLIEREGSQWVARDLSPRPGLHVAPGRKPVWPAGRDPLRRWSRPVNRTNPRGCVLEAPPAWCQPVQVERSLTAEFGKPRASGYPRQSPPPGQKPR